jgi:hypothetical protein
VVECTCYGLYWVWHFTVANMTCCCSLSSAATACRATILEIVCLKVMAVGPVYTQETVSTVWTQTVQLRYVCSYISVCHYMYCGPLLDSVLSSHIHCHYKNKIFHVLIPYTEQEPQDFNFMLKFAC